MLLRNAAIMGMALLISTPSFAEREAKTIGKDSRVKVVKYDETDVVKFYGHDLVTTEITFAPDEQILDIAIGDTLAWSVQRSDSFKNTFYLKPSIKESKTNMTVLTDKRSYHFDIRVDEKISANPKLAVYRLQFEYPNLTKTKSSDAFKDYPDGAGYGNPVKWNWHYEYFGSNDTAPKLVFDDKKHFTYFAFPDLAHIPAIYAVDSHRHESLVNYRMEDGFVVVERIAKQFTLRDGESVASVFSEVE